MNVKAAARLDRRGALTDATRNLVEQTANAEEHKANDVSRIRLILPHSTDILLRVDPGLNGNFHCFSEAATVPARIML